MVSSYPPVTQFNQPVSPYPRRFQTPAFQPFSPQFIGHHSQPAELLTAKKLSAKSAIPSTIVKKSGWLKKLVIGAGVTAGLYFFGRKTAGAVSGAVSKKLVGQLGKALPSGKVGAQLEKSATDASAKEFNLLLETLKKAGLQSENLSGFLKSGSGKFLLNIAQSEQGISLFRKLASGVAGKYLPKPALEMLEKQATSENIRKLLDAGMLANVLKYGGRLYQENAGHFRSYLKNNAESISEQLSRLTGFKPEKIADSLKALQ